MISFHMGTRQKKQLIQLCLIMLPLWAALMSVILVITPTRSTVTQQQAQPLFSDSAWHKVLAVPSQAHTLAETLPEPLEKIAQPIKLSDHQAKSPQINNPDDSSHKIQSTIKEISDLIGQDQDYDSDSEALAQLRQALSTLIKQDPQLSKSLIAQILEDPHSNISAELSSTLGQSQNPELEKIIAQQLASATDQERIYLLGITQYWERSSPVVVDSVLQGLQFATSNLAQISALETLQYSETISAEAKQTANDLIISIVDNNTDVEVVSSALRTLGAIATDPIHLQKTLDALNHQNTDLQSAALDALTSTSITSDEIKEKLVGYASTQEDCLLYEQAISSLSHYTLTTEERKLVDSQMGQCELSDPVSSTGY